MCSRNVIFGICFAVVGVGIACQTSTTGNMDSGVSDVLDATSSQSETIALVPIESANPDTPYHRVRVLGTHNSYEPKRHYASIREQLDAGIRLIEIDIHHLPFSGAQTLKDDYAFHTSAVIDQKTIWAALEQSNGLWLWQGTLLADGTIAWRSKRRISETGQFPSLAFAPDHGLLLAYEEGDLGKEMVVLRYGAWNDSSESIVWQTPVSVGAGRKPSVAYHDASGLAVTVLALDGTPRVYRGSITKTGSISLCDLPVDMPGIDSEKHINNNILSVYETSWIAVTEKSGAVTLDAGPLEGDCALGAPSEHHELGKGVTPALSIASNGTFGIVAENEGKLLVWSGTLTSDPLSVSVNVLDSPPLPTGRNPSLALGVQADKRLELGVLARSPTGSKLQIQRANNLKWFTISGYYFRVAHLAHYLEDAETGYDPEIGYVTYPEVGEPIYGPAYFEEYLEHVAAWHREVPDHTPLAIVLDMKDQEVVKRINDVMGAVRRILGEHALFKPEALRGSYPTLRAAVRAQAWPSLSALKGKFIIVFSGAGAMEDHPFAFKEVNWVPFCLLEGTSAVCDEVAFYGEESSLTPSSDIAKLVDHGFLVRLWKVDSVAKKQTAENRRVQWLGGDFFKMKGWELSTPSQ